MGAFGRCAYVRCNLMGPSIAEELVSFRIIFVPVHLCSFLFLPFRSISFSMFVPFSFLSWVQPMGQPMGSTHGSNPWVEPMGRRIGRTHGSAHGSTPGTTHESSHGSSHWSSLGSSHGSFHGPTRGFGPWAVPWVDPRPKIIIGQMAGPPGHPDGQRA